MKAPSLACAALVLLASVVFATNLAAAPANHHSASPHSADRLPDIPDDLPYPKTRRMLRGQGFAPQPVFKRYGVRCEGKDAQYDCRKWPEWVSCGSGYCLFFYRRVRDGRILMVETYAERFALAYWPRADELDDIEFPPGTKWYLGRPTPIGPALENALPGWRTEPPRRAPAQP